MALLKFYSPDKIEYAMRMHLQSIATIEGLLYWYLQNEPHTLTSAGFLNKFIVKHQLNNLSALNIGVDFLKEALINKSTGVKLTSFDIDGNFIKVCNELNDKLNLGNQFITGNLLEEPLSGFISKKFDFATLIQMDYNFNDVELKSIFDIFFNNNIETVVVFTPSIYSFAKYDIINVLEFIWEYYGAMKTWKLKDIAKKVTYRRTQRHLCNLLLDKYKLTDSQRFKYPYGRIHMLRFDICK